MKLLKVLTTYYIALRICCTGSAITFIAATVTVNDSDALDFNSIIK